jgi:hypothetical protein
MLFTEPASAVIVSLDRAKIANLKTIAERHGLFMMEIGEVRGNALEISIDTVKVVSIPVPGLTAVWSEALESQLAEEVTA